MIISILLSLSLAWAAPGDDCQPEQILLGDLAINRQFTVADGCLVQVRPVNPQNQLYREYVFDQSGRMLIFNSTSGPYQTATSQQNYFLLPVTRVPTIERQGDVVYVTLANDSRVKFTATSLFIESASEDLIVRETGKVDLDPSGNFAIEKFSGILLNAGFAIGRRAYVDPQAESEFIVGGQRCRVKNEELFVYKDAISGQAFYQPILMFTAGPVLESFLKRRCAN